MMVSIAQLVRASDCGSEGRGFDPHCSPSENKGSEFLILYFFGMTGMSYICGENPLTIEDESM